MSRPILHLTLSGALVLCSCVDAPTHVDSVTDPEDQPETPILVPATAALAFVSNRDGLEDIYVANADGSEVTRVGQGTSPAWSPDGRRLAFTRGWNILAMNVNGTDVRFLTEGVHPAWAPDGRIAFTTSTLDPDGGIKVMDDRAPSEARLLLRHGWAEQFNHSPGYGVDMVSHPTWSPDGRQIAFWLYAGYMGTHSVGIINADGSDPVDLQERRVQGGNQQILLLATWGRPAWSPDGSRIATLSSFGLFVLERDSGVGEPVWLTDPLFPENPDWSPDGRHLLFDAFSTSAPGPGSPAGSRRRIFTVSLESGEVHRLIPEAEAPTNPDYGDYAAVWLRATP